MQARIEVNICEILALLGVKVFAGRLTPAIRLLFVRASNEEEARMNVRYRVELSQTERAELTALLSGGKRAARKLKRAQILLAADAGASDDEIARSVGAGGSTVYRTKQRFVLGNLEAALSEKPRPGASRKLRGKEEALVVATACSKPPAGRARWTLELLAGELVRLTEHDSLSRETVRRRLAENDLKPWRKDMWCIPQVDAEYVARMEDVLDLYAEAVVSMPAHKFQVGDHVQWSQPYRHMTTDVYEIIKQFPEGNGEFHYRIKGFHEPHARMATESELGQLLPTMPMISTAPTCSSLSPTR